MRYEFLVAKLIGVAVVTVAIGSSPAAAQLSGIGQVLERANEAAASVDGTKSLDEFRAWATAYMDHPQGNVMLPKKWFDSHFDGDTARALKAEYAKAARMYGGLGAEVAKQKGFGKIKLVVAIHTKAVDPTATGWQNAALQRMTKPTPLYSMRMMQPNAQTGFSLLSFVYTEGRFAFAGKLSALHDPKGDLATKVLCTTPIGKMEKILQDKGLIKTSAVEHLRQVGVLK